MKNSEVPGDTILATAEFMINVLLDSVPTGLEKGLYTMRGYNMPIVKNKNEAITVDDIYTKTRLFENYSAPATTLPQIFFNLYDTFRPCMTKPNKDIMMEAGRDPNDFTVPIFKIENLSPAIIKDIIVHGNMSGWSVVKGWMNSFVKLMSNNQEVGNCIVMYYADNLSVFCCIMTKKGPVWRGWSIDGEKMEG